MQIKNKYTERWDFLIATHGFPAHLKGDSNKLSRFLVRNPGNGIHTIVYEWISIVHPILRKLKSDSYFYFFYVYFFNSQKFLRILESLPKELLTTFNNRITYIKEGWEELKHTIWLNIDGVWKTYFLLSEGPITSPYWGFFEDIDHLKGFITRYNCWHGHITRRCSPTNACLACMACFLCWLPVICGPALFWLVLRGKFFTNVFRVFLRCCGLLTAVFLFILFVYSFFAPFVDFLWCLVEFWSSEELSGVFWLRVFSGCVFALSWGGVCFLFPWFFKVFVFYNLYIPFWRGVKPVPTKFADHIISVYENTPIRNDLLAKTFGKDISRVILRFLLEWHVYDEFFGYELE